MVRKIQNMVAAVTFLVIGTAIFAPSAFATNGHQDHQGACSRSTESISKMVGDLKFNGVLQNFANSMGIHGFNGSLTKQMEEKTVVAVAVHATAMHNHGCDGAGGVFSAGTRVIEKGEHVVVRIPPKFGKEVCRNPSSQCKKVKVVVHVALPVSCGNKNTGRLEVWMWMRKPKKPKPHHKHHKKHHRSCKAQGKINVNGNCVKQTVNQRQECEAKGGSWNENLLICVQVAQPGVCSAQSGVVNGNNNTVNQDVNCGQETWTCVNNSCNVTESPPPCECKPKPEPPAVEWERIQEVVTNHSRNLCVTVTPATGVEVQFAVAEGARSNGGKGVYNASTNKYCVTYTAPSEEPSHVCEEPISSTLPAGTKCDVAHVAVFSSNGAETVKGKMEIPIIKEEKAVVW